MNHELYYKLKRLNPKLAKAMQELQNAIDKQTRILNKD